MASVATRHQDPSGSSSASANRPATVSRKRTNGSSSKDDAKMIGQWRIGRTIGKGSSGRVKIAKHSITGKYAAIKIVPKGLILNSRMSMSEAGARADKVLLGIEREIVIMKLIDHPNVLNLYDVWETSSELYLIMEYVPGGELFDYLVKRGRLPISEALHYFQQIIHAVDYCHRFNICHRDLKPENLLLDKDKNIKVADFGMAAWEAGERMLETSCGSPHYASPEIVAGKAYHGSSSDIWSCGIILFALLTGRLPFDDDNIRSLLQKVKIGVFEMPDEIKDPARNLLTRMLEKDPERRITMPEILQHPFFVSRPTRPIPGRALVSPPSLDEVERPVNSPEEIDADIMGNLKTLWSGASDEEIITALMSKEKTWEKAIYHLLIKYRNRHLENYNMDEDEDAERARRHARKAQQGSSPAKRKGGPPAPQVSGKPKLAVLGENESIENTPVVRPQAPTPKKALGQPHVTGSEDSPVVSRIVKGKLTPGKSPVGPRPPMSNRNSSTESSVPMPTTPTPAIVLQGATPTKDMPPPDFIPSPPGSASNSASSRPRSEVLSSLPETPQLPPINAPVVPNQTLQHFFNEVAAQLNTMNIRSSVASGSSTTSSAILGTDYQAYLAYASGATPNNTTLPSTVVEEEGAEQFADADDDETEADVASIHSTFTASIAGGHGPTSPLVGLGLGGPPPPSHGGRPGLYPTNNPNTNRWSYASSTGSSHRGTSNGSYGAPMESPQIYSPQNIWDTQLPHPHPMASPQPQPIPVFQAERPAPIPPPRANRPAPPPVTRITVPQTDINTTESLLPRDNSYVIIDSSDMASDPSISSWSTKSSGFRAHRGSDGFGMLKKKIKNVSIDPVPYGHNGNDLLGPPSATPSFASGSSSINGISPKRSWFNNLFSFKAPSFTLLAQDNISSTRDRVRKILNEQNVRVALVEIDGVRGLKCRLDDVRESSGAGVQRGIRFKVEFSRANQSAGQNYNTLVTLTLEKGAQSTFRTMFVSLKSRIESSNPPRPQSIMLRSSPQQPTSAVIPSHPQPLLSAPPIRYTSSAPTTPIVPSSPRFGDHRSHLPPTPGSVQIPSTIRF
ncbi:hypothetical protein I302_103963 [Kwoniella bestiolae CBS 10118]|uniref:non-specific serine/threonine protein kinase n=1 Tax=Kwoniella bestiolae CBS 10118 TaxID=1296100 RepID=A0A1B9GA23_9TREE|nr:CAMK/CAMKL/GIN4 protein kinase [Kwoniella bestiolae CBS 10118]OCF27820.1 CAMK/CAMKL/GIN4 protein kinase [Kwoniella bestiolae CBS 10118]